MYGSTVAPYVFLWNTGVLVDKENEKKKNNSVPFFKSFGVLIMTGTWNVHK